MKRRQMATPSRAKASGRPTQPSRMARAGRAAAANAPLDLRRSIFNLALWGLGMVNVLLIFFGVWNRYFATGNEHTISSETAVVVEPETALKIEVRNGCGVDGLARKVAEHLKKQGFDPVRVDNFERSDMPRTMIIDRLSNSMVNGRKVAQALGLSDDYVSYLSSPELMVSVSVYIGQDHKSIQLAPNK